ncbi:hypothetical protein ACFQ07_20770, partial [Actinomadura adrarensis]
MTGLNDYVLAIRTPDSPPGPPGVKSVELVPREGDPATSIVQALRASALTAADFRARVVFLAPEGARCLIPYAGLCGFAGRRIDAYADGA